MSTLSGEAIHPIGVAAERAGVSPDVIRAWERRYGVVEPQRDDAGRRVYTTADIDRLRLLARATEGGHSIGQVVELDREALEELVRQGEAARRNARPPAEVPASAAQAVAGALARVRSLDAAGLEALLLRAASVHGVPVFLRSVLAPLFRSIGDLWHAGKLTPSQEHLATATVRGVLARILGTIPLATEAPSILVATPTGERHEIGALLAAAEATVEGWRVTFLGGDLPAEEIARAARDTDARAVALGSIYAPDPEKLRREVDRVRAELPADVVLLLGGPAMAIAAADLNGGGVHVLADLDDLTARLRAMAAG